MFHLREAPALFPELYHYRKPLISDDYVDK
jgi:hypothetical protein